MPSGVEQESPVGIIAKGSLGPGNKGNIGPASDREKNFADRLGSPEYQLPPRDESHCMDDRLEVHGIQLAGNRATTETAGDFLDPDAEKLPLSKRFERNVKRLLEEDATPYFHPGCAALLLLANGEAIKFIADKKNQPLLTSMTDGRLRLLGIDTISPNDYQNAYEAAAEATDDESLWDSSPEKLMAIAESLGAPVDPIEGEHSACAARWDMSESIFDNTGFRREHSDDMGNPMGALSVTLGAYKKQLEDTGQQPQEAALKVMRATLFNLAVLKLAQKEDAPDVIVGNTLVVD